MAFWEMFKKGTEDSDQSQLYHELRDELPELEENELVKVACVSGLLARVAYVDFKLDPKELEHIDQVLKKWTQFDDKTIKLISQASLKHIKEFAGIENHLYARPLKEVLGENERFKLVEALFALAASDGSVEHLESEEIRLICRGLELSDQHYLGARAQVMEYLKALQK